MTNEKIESLKDTIEEYKKANKFFSFIICVLLVAIMIGFISMLIIKTGVKDIYTTALSPKSKVAQLCYAICHSKMKMVVKQYTAI